MNTIIGELGKSNKFVDLSKQIQNKKSPISISGLTDVGMVELLSAINQYNKKPILLITYNEIQAKQILEIIKIVFHRAVVEMMLKRNRKRLNRAVNPKYAKIDDRNHEKRPDTYEFFRAGFLFFARRKRAPRGGKIFLF